MAILDHLPGVEVTISCKEVKVAEYDDDEDEVRLAWKPKTVSKFVESVSDTEFFIQLQVGPPYEFDHDSLCFNIIMDGDEAVVDGYFCHPDDFVNGIWAHEAEGREGLTNRGSILRKYKYAHLRTIDEPTDDLSKVEKEEMAKIGLIEVRVYEMRKSRKTKSPVLEELTRSWEIIPENILKGKAISHRVTYGDETVVKSPSVYQTPKYVDGWDAPIGVFRFKYRSRDDLEKQWIIPRAASPEEQVPRSRGFEDLTAEERHQWARVKFDEMRLISTLASVTSEASDPTESPMFIRVFEDLDEDEVTQLARQKHAEITGAAVKQEPAIKQESGRENSSGTPRPNAKQHNQVAIANGKMAIDLTEDSDDDDEDDEDCIEISDNPFTSEELGTSSRIKPITEETATAEAGQKKTTADTDTQINADIAIAVAIPTPTAATDPAPSQPIVRASDMIEPITTTTNTTTVATAATPSPEITTQPTQPVQPTQPTPPAQPVPTESMNPPSADEAGSSAEIQDGPRAKKRKIRGFSGGMAKARKGTAMATATVMRAERPLFCVPSRLVGA